jgi:hypothetical protein
MEMTQAKFVLASLVAGVTLGWLGSGNTEAANVLASSDREIVIPGNDAEPSGAITENNTEDSANMGKEEDTHTGPNQGAAPGSDTEKVDQPASLNPTTGGGDDSKE